MGAGTSVISANGLTTLQGSVNSSLDRLKQYQSDPDAKSLSGSYYNLQQAINATIKDISGASSNTIAAEQSGYTTQMINLDAQRDVVLTRIKGYTIYDTLRQVSYCIGMVFAAIIITNFMVSEPWYYKLFFYAPWGMIFYPVVLLYCLYDPPVWRAPLFPLVEVSTSMPAWLRNLQFISYSPLGKIQEGSDGSTTLRAFTALVVAFGITVQFLK